MNFILSYRNELVLLLEIAAVFSSLLLVNRFLKKEGLIAWIAIASVLANVITAKQSLIFGSVVSIGTVLFASTFLATDILTERFGKQAAKKGVIMGMVGSLALIGATQICLLYTPVGAEIVDYMPFIEQSMETLFSLNLRISISSVIMYFVANMADVYIYDKFKSKMNGKHKWIRNNVSTILCNCLENFLFFTGAFLGVMPFGVIMQTALATSVIEIIVGLCDTPFLYIATRKQILNSATKD